MTDELPPLPEPAYWMTRESEHRMKRYGGNYQGAVPVHNKSSPSAILPLYTADQLRAAVLAERERCAKVCEDRAKFWDANAPEGDEHVYAYWQEEAAWCADAIRAETTKRPDPKTGA